LIARGDSFGAKMNPKRAALELQDLGRHGLALLLPQREASIDQADMLDAQVAEQPPEPGSVELTSCVVDQDFRVGPNAQRLDPRLPRIAVGQGASLGGHRLHGLGIDPDGAGNVSPLIFNARPGVDQTAVRLVKAMLELVKTHEPAARCSPISSWSDQNHSE